MALVRRSLIVTLHKGLNVGLADMSSVATVVHTSLSMGLAGIVEPDRIAVPAQTGDQRLVEAAPHQMCTKGDSSL